MSVRRVENGAGERKGGVAGRLAAVLSIGAQGGDDDRKRQRTSLFEYGTEYKGTVRGEAEVFRHHASLSIASEPRIHYYVEMDGVDEKFYFYNVKEQHGIRSLGLTYTFEANFKGTTYRFIDGMETFSSTPGQDPVFAPGTRVLFKPIPATEFKATGEWMGKTYGSEQPTWPVKGEKAATMIKRIDEASSSSSSSSSSSHAMVRAEGSGEGSRLHEVEENLKAIKRFFDGELISLEEYETKRKELLGRI